MITKYTAKGGNFPLCRLPIFSGNLLFYHRLIDQKLGRHTLPDLRAVQFDVCMKKKINVINCKVVSFNLCTASKSKIYQSTVILTSVAMANVVHDKSFRQNCLTAIRDHIVSGANHPASLYLE